MKLRHPKRGFAFTRGDRHSPVRDALADRATVRMFRTRGGELVDVALDRETGQMFSWAVHGGNPYHVRMRDHVSPKPNRPFAAPIRDNSGAWAAGAPPGVRVPFSSTGLIRNPDDLFRVVRRIGAEVGLAVPAEDKAIPGGFYGKIIFGTMTPALSKRLKALHARLKYVLGSPRMPPMGHKVVIKVFRPSDLDRLDRQPRPGQVYDVGDTVRELQAHRTMQEACRMIGGRTHCLRENVPALWFGGVDPETGAGVAVMDAVSGNTLNDHLDRHHRLLSAREYVGLEKATVLMLALGMAHSDYHGGNVFVRPDGSAAILDFGFAMNIPADLLPDMASPEGLLRALDTLEDWVPRVNDYTAGVLLTRGFPKLYFNPEIQLLRVAYSHVPASQRDAIHQERLRAWKLGASPARPTPAPARTSPVARQPSWAQFVAALNKGKTPPRHAKRVRSSGSQRSVVTMDWASTSPPHKKLQTTLQSVASRRRHDSGPVPMSIG